MDLPVLLPKHFLVLEKMENQDEALNWLINEPDGLIFFLEQACEDEAWAHAHPDFMRKVLVHLTRKLWLSTLSYETAERMQKVIFDHYQAIAHAIPHEIQLERKGSAGKINGVLFITSSAYFSTLFEKECIQKRSANLALQHGSTESLAVALEFMKTGKVELLWKKERQVVLNILADAADWGMHGLVALCAKIMERYINKVNVVQLLLMAHQEQWIELRDACYTFINERELGIVLLPSSSEHISIKFLKFTEEGVDLFKKIKEYVTHLAVVGNMPADSLFVEIIEDIPRLLGLDISETISYSDYILKAPRHIDELNLSRCQWVDQGTLRPILDHFPYLKSLKLSSNTQLNYKGWGSLTRLQGLETLDIARCTSLTDEEFKFVCFGVDHLLEIDMEDCERLTDRSFLELAKRAKKLKVVNFSSCNMTDIAIIDVCNRCTQLRKLGLSRCLHISDRGVVECVKLAVFLEELDISNSPISDGAVQQIRALRPKLVLKN